MQNLFVTVVIFIFFLPFQGFSQEGTPSSWQFIFNVKGNLSTKVWSKDFDKEIFQQYPEFTFKPGYGFSFDVVKNFNPKWYFKLSGEFAERNTAIKSPGYLQILDENGLLKTVMCKRIDQKIHQVLFHAGIGYSVLPFLSVELSPYIQADVTDEKNKACDITDWQRDEFFEKAIDFGISPSLRFTWKKWHFTVNYVHGFGKPNQIKLTDAIGAEIGTYANQYRMISAGLGYTIW